MVKPEWGMKRLCHGCGSRFYDLRRSPIVCPVCNAVHDPERQPKPRRGGSSIKDDALVTSKHRDDDMDATMDGDGDADSGIDSDLEDVEGGDGDGQGDLEDLSAEDRELMEDTSDLGEDVDDIGEVMEHVDDEIDEKP